jgi:hypothetical protein
MNKTVSADIPRDLRDVLADLGYIKGLPTGCKYNIKDKTYPSADSWLAAALRGWKDESKKGAIDYINNTLDRSIEMGRRYPAWKDFLTERVSEISNAMTNMEHTYAPRFPGIKSDIDLISLRIQPEAFRMACQQRPIIPINPLTNPSYYHLSSDRDGTPPSGSSPVDRLILRDGSSPTIWGSTPPSRPSYPTGSSPPVKSASNMIIWGSSPPKLSKSAQDSPVLPGSSDSESEKQYRRRTRRRVRDIDIGTEEETETEILKGMSPTQPSPLTVSSTSKIPIKSGDSKVKLSSTSGSQEEQ